MLTRRRRSEVVRCEGTTSGGHRTESQHGLVDLAGGLLAQEARVVALDGEQGHDPWRKNHSKPRLGVKRHNSEPKK